MKVRSMLASDWPSVSTIYAEGIATGFATFETVVPTWEDWDSSHMKSCRVVVEDQNTILGWAALTPVSSRCVYGGVAEVSVYVSNQSRGKGVGSILLQALIDQSEDAGIWSLQAGVFPQNKASINLHLKMGFRLIGTRESIAKLNGQWNDNCMLERRSKTVGID